VPIIISPTAAMLTRIADRSGGGGDGTGSAAGGKVGGGSGMGSAGGAVAQAASCSARSRKNILIKLVTEPDTHDIDFCCPEPTSSEVQFVKIVDGADVDPKVIPIIDLCTLHARHDALQR